MKKERLITFLVMLGIILGFPSIMYLVKNLGDISGYNKEYYYFFNCNSNIDGIIYFIFLLFIFIIYIKLIKESERFSGIKEILLMSFIVGIVFLVCLPNTSKDVFFYMGNGRILDKYGMNPYLYSVRRC